MNGFGSLEDTGDFVGNYVVDVKAAIITAVISDQHLMLIGEPGVGKTSITKAMFERMFGDDWKFQSFSPATQPEAVEGLLDTKLAFEQGIYAPVIENTISDPRMKGILLDEFSRANDPVLELLMPRLARDGMPDGYAPVAVATVNWIPKDARMEAPVDRFGLQKKIRKHEPEYGVVSRKMLTARTEGRRQSKDIGGGVPDWDTIVEVRSAQPTDSTVGAVQRLIEQFCEMCVTGLVDSDGKPKRQFVPNYRRLEAWTSIAYYMSVLHYGKPDFDEVHPRARQALAYAWVTQDDDELDDWNTFMGEGVLDPIDALIGTMYEQATGQLSKMFSDSVSTSNKAKVALDFGLMINKKADEIRQAMKENGVDKPDDDPRFMVTFERLLEALRRVNQGQSPFGGNDEQV